MGSNYNKINLQKTPGFKKDTIRSFYKNDKKSSLLIMSYKILNYLALKICDLYTVASFSDYEL